MASSLARGSSVAHYRIVSTIGAGGMGEVYEARDEHLDRAIALKILPPDLVQNEDRVRRFVQEAKSASGLNHPNIVTIYDIGHTEPTVHPAEGSPEQAKAVHFIAMELVRGRTLRDKIHHESVPLKELLRWLAQAAEGMAKAHAAGIVHRDLKPENIMISSDGFAKILDFGLAKLTERRISGEGAASALPTDVRHKTREGAVLGTVGYMAPEQVQGKVVDERSDIFSFGCMLYEAATRRRPFEADSDIETMHQIITAEPPPVSELNPQAPSELRKLIRRCLAKDPERRFQSMKDLALELYDLVDEFDQLSLSAASRSSGSAEAPAVPLPRNRWMIPAAIFMAGLLAGAGLYFGVQRATGRSGARTGVAGATFNRLTDMAGQEREPSISPDGVFVAYAADQSLDNRRPDIFLLRVGGRKPINLTEDSPEADRTPAFSPDGQWIAFQSDRSGGGIYVMGATGESVRRLAEFGYNPSWSPDGQKIVFSTEGGNNPRARTTTARLWVVDVKTSEKKEIFPGDAVSPKWSPDGKWIAFWSLPHRERGQRDISVVSAAGGPRIPITEDAALDWSPAWAPDGQTLYFVSDRSGSMNLWRVAIDPATGKPADALEQVTTPSESMGEVSIASKSGAIVFASRSGELNVHKLEFNAATGTAAASDTPITTGGTMFLESDLTPDGKEVVLRTFSGQEDILIAHADGTGMRKITDDPHKDRGPRWMPDGKRIVFYSDRSGRYDFWMVDPDGSNLKQITKTEGRSIWFPIPSPDGKRLAASNEQGPMIFDLGGPLPVTSGRKLAPGDQRLTFFISDWSPDGKYLIGTSVQSAMDQPGIWMYDVAAERWEKISEDGMGFDSSASWLADSRRFIFAQGDSILLGDRITKQSKVIFREPGSTLQGASAIFGDQGAIIFQKAKDEGDIWMATLQ